jgi:hypothetical protein
MAEPTHDELVAFSAHVLYGVHVLFRSGRSLMRARMGLGRPLAWEVETALLESFALHARALHDFFYKPKRGRHGDDALAMDYVGQRRWEKARPEAGEWSKYIKDPSEHLDRVGREVLHLSYWRLSTDAQAVRGWPVMQIAGEVGAVLRLFIENVADRLVVPNFKGDAMAEIPAFVRISGSGAAPAFWPRAASVEMSPSARLRSS